MLSQRPRRFWKQATVIAAAEGEGFSIALDGRPVRVPSKQPLVIASRALADAVAEEWNAQGETMDPFSMPLTQLANTAQDRVGPLRAEIIGELLAHAGSEVLCYRAVGPDDLCARQAKAWDPLLDWARERFGCSWPVTSGIVALTDVRPMRDALGVALEALDAERLTGLQVAAPLCGSMIVGFALVEGRVDADEAFAVSHLDELYQAAKWGEDREAVQRRSRIRGELQDVERYLALALG